MKSYVRKHLKSILPPEVHLPNKNEAKLLRKLKQQTGMTEEEIRSHKKYRILLSQAQKDVRKHTTIEKRFIGVVKDVTKKLKLAKEHPNVVAEVGKIIKERQVGKRYSLIIKNDYSNMPTTPSKLLEYMKELDNKNKVHENNRQGKTK